ncbi:hypothetical protein BJY01DRAFT_243340 [Aspergillus pseudoustus]|uniref:CFEM domain-containing protein n=1 Tax=Aspergillus pseudoustus TaxID=1810923 RepID=A0ABR4KTP4_9EURO
MRYILPVALFGGAAVVAAQSPEDLINNLLPQCLRSCATDALETATGCKISDTDCLCTSDGALGSDVLNSLMTDLTNCALNSECQLSDLEGLADLDANSLEEQAAGICGGSTTTTGGSSTSTPTGSSDDSSSTSTPTSSSDDSSSTSTPTSPSDESSTPTNSSDDSSSSSSSTDNNSSSNTNDDSAPAQESDDAGDGAMTLSGTTAIIAAGVVMAIAAL